MTEDAPAATLGSARAETMPPSVAPATLRLMRLMTGPPPSHERFEAVDPSQIDALALGDLWALAHATETHIKHEPVQTVAAQTAQAILGIGREREPAFRGPACRDYLDVIGAKAEQESEAERTGLSARYPLQDACFALARCTDLSFAGLGPAADRVLAATHWPAMPHLAVALSRLVGTACEARVLAKLAADLADSPLLVGELRTVAALDLVDNISVADIIHPNTYRSGSPTGEPCEGLLAFPAYAAFAQTGLTQAAERVRLIHAGETPYAADKAFTLEDSAVIARLARVALARDDPWVPNVLGELFRKVSLAPTSARTVPSQSVAIALGHAVAAAPTPEAVAILRDVLRDVRHAGVAKKLKQNLPRAERGLADRPAVALRLVTDETMSKQQLATLARCLEAGFGAALALRFDDWCARLAAHPQAKALAGALVWRVHDDAGGSTSILPVARRSGLVLNDVAGGIVAARPDQRVTLWHPAEASADERVAWRDRIVGLRIKQPFKQVFREHYAVPAAELPQSATKMFAGHVVSIRPFLGLARHEGWRLEYDGLARTVGGVFVRIDLADAVFPGAFGETTVRNIGVSTVRSRREMPAKLGDLSAVTLSEILRSADLLVSTSGFALSDADPAAPRDDAREAHLRALAEQPLGPMAEMRKDALARALAGRAGLAGLRFDARHLRVGPYAIHLATGRVTRDGDPVAIDMPDRAEIAAVPWLPYDEKLLETIAVTALQLGSRGGDLWR